MNSLFARAAFGIAHGAGPHLGQGGGSDEPIAPVLRAQVRAGLENRPHALNGEAQRGGGLGGGQHLNAFRRRSPAPASRARGAYIVQPQPRIGFGVAAGAVVAPNRRAARYHAFLPQLVLGFSMVRPGAPIVARDPGAGHHGRLFP